MTTEEKAKAYDEAIERAKTKLTNEVASYIFPELKESEGERIRQDIITTLSMGVACEESALHPGAHTTLKEAIAWLDEQCEQKPWSEEDEKTWKELIEEVKDQLDCVPAPDCRDEEDEKVLKQLNKWLTWLKSLKERYTWKPSEEQMSALKEQCVCKKSTAAGAVLCELFHDLEKLKG